MGSVFIDNSKKLTEPDYIEKGRKNFSSCLHTVKF